MDRDPCVDRWLRRTREATPSCWWLRDLRRGYDSAESPWAMRRSPLCVARQAGGVERRWQASPVAATASDTPVATHADLPTKRSPAQGGPISLVHNGIARIT